MYVQDYLHRWRACDELAGLREVHKVMRDSAEVLAVLIGSIRGDESVSEEILSVAESSMLELSQWSQKLRDLLSSADEPSEVLKNLH